MNLIRPSGWIGLGLTLALTGGCASQDSILPASEKTMADIYRSALNTVQAGDVDTLDPAAVCARLVLNEGVAACEAKVRAHAEQVYRALDTQPLPEPLDYLPYTRTVDNELEALFPRLANPDLVIYVYPHLATRTRAPIPGYSTVIPLYERVEYRLPGESLMVTPQPTGLTPASPASGETGEGE